MQKGDSRFSNRGLPFSVVALASGGGVSPIGQCGDYAGSILDAKGIFSSRKSDLTRREFSWIIVI